MAAGSMMPDKTQLMTSSWLHTACPVLLNTMHQHTLACLALTIKTLCCIHDQLTVMPYHIGSASIILFMLSSTNIYEL